ncbi:MAG TPA: hypothetical protein H9790_10090, partial [Candidatus Agathobaculum intestinipullorum]|nr:hypothetical protein [Candidatus Agathobaculum intestinipullorum]
FGRAGPWLILSGHLLPHSNSFSFEMEKDAAGCRALYRNYYCRRLTIMSSSHLKPTENPRKMSNFSIGDVKKFAGNVVIVAICEAK